MIYFKLNKPIMCLVLFTIILWHYWVSGFPAHTDAQLFLALSLRAVFSCRQLSPDLPRPLNASLISRALGTLKIQTKQPKLKQYLI